MPFSTPDEGKAWWIRGWGLGGLCLINPSQVDPTGCPGVTKFPMDPAVLKTLRDSELLRRSAFHYTAQIFYSVNPSLRETMPVIPREMNVSTQRGRDSKSLGYIFVCFFSFPKLSKSVKRNLTFLTKTAKHPQKVSKKNNLRHFSTIFTQHQFSALSWGALIVLKHNLPFQG